eukprot:3426383-Prymnesium_polylepis.1
MGLVPDERRKGEAALGGRCRLLDFCRSSRGLDSRTGSSGSAFVSGAGRAVVVEIITSSSSA